MPVPSGEKEDLNLFKISSLYGTASGDSVDFVKPTTADGPIKIETEEFKDVMAIEVENYAGVNIRSISRDSFLKKAQEDMAEINN